MTFTEHGEAKRLAQRAGFPVVGSELIAAEDGEAYAVRIQDVEAGRTLTFLFLASMEAYIAAAEVETTRGSAYAA